MQKLVTVIIPTRNSAKFFNACVESVQHQSFNDFDVVVVDANSTDETRDIASTLPNLRFVPQTGHGLAAAWNQGIKLSATPYVCFLDSDDWWERDCLLRHVNALRSNPSKAYSIGCVRYFSDDTSKLPRGFKPTLLDGLHPALMPGCFLGKRQLFERIGYFDEGLSVATDIQWFHDLKMSQIPFVSLDAHVLNKRVHDDNLSYTSSETNLYSSELLQVIHRRLQHKPND